MPDNAYTAGILTLGCKVNQYESEALAEALAARGFRVQSPERVCDLYVINTCTVTAESDRKSCQIIRRARHRNPRAWILVTGCLAQVSPGRVAAIPSVDAVCGNAEKLAVAETAAALAARGRKNQAPELRVGPPDALGYEPMRISRFGRTRAYLKIEDGCENRCAYCIIPNARGRVRSRPPADVLEEAARLTAGGCRELVLTGIETASYGRDLPGVSLADLLCRVDRIPGVGRVRLGSLDPSVLRPEFVSRIAQLPSLAPHFHLSVQSGSDGVLARMRRKYNTRMMREGIRRLQEAIPGVQLTADMIAGFPQETEEEFEETLRFAGEVGFLNIHIFPYSERQGTPAAAMPGQVPAAVRHARAARLTALQAGVRRGILDRMTGSTAEVLFETWRDGVATGHTGSFVEVACPSPVPLHARLLPVRILSNDGVRCSGAPEFPFPPPSERNGTQP